MSKITELLHLTKHNLSKENEQFVGEYVEMVLKKFRELSNIGEEEALKYIEDSAFIVTMNSDPEYVVNYDSGYWAERLFERKNMFEEYKKLNGN